MVCYRATRKQKLDDTHSIDMGQEQAKLESVQTGSPTVIAETDNTILKDDGREEEPEPAYMPSHMAEDGELAEQAGVDRFDKREKTAIVWGDVAKQPIESLPYGLEFFEYKDHKARAVCCAKGGWRFQWPNLSKQPAWTIPNKNRNVPAEAHPLIRRLAVDGPALWRRWKGNRQKSDDDLDTPHWIQRLAEDLAPLQELQHHVRQSSELTAYVKDKELLVADFMYAFAQAEGGYDGAPLLFMNDQHAERTHAVVGTSYAYRGRLSDFEYGRVRARFRGAMERTYSVTEAQQQQSPDSMADLICAKLGTSYACRAADADSREPEERLQYWYANSVNKLPQPVPLIGMVPTVTDMKSQGNSTASRAVTNLQAAAHQAFTNHVTLIQEHYTVLHNLLVSYTRNPMQGSPSAHPNVMPRKRPGHNECDGLPCVFAEAAEHVDLGDRRCQVVQKAAWLLISYVEKVAVGARWTAADMFPDEEHHDGTKTAFEELLLMMIVVALQTHFDGYVAYIRSQGLEVKQPQVSKLGIVCASSWTIKDWQESMQGQRSVLRGADGSLTSGVDEVE